MKITEQIKTWPEDAIVALIRESLSLQARTMQSLGNVGTVAKLKALAESHDRLLKAAKRYRGEVHDGTTAEDGKSLTEILDEAIKEAEKL